MISEDNLSSDKIISYADFSLPFTRVCDASDTAIGAVILQVNDNKQRIVATNNHTLNETQRKWSATEREAYALLFFVEKMTDHRGLTFLDRSTSAKVKLASWQERLSLYNWVI